MARLFDTEDARRLLREMLWEKRDLHLDRILFHQCDLHDLTVLLVQTAGWSEEAFVMAVLADTRGMLDG